MSFLRVLWHWTAFAVAALLALVVLFAAPIASLLGTGPDAAARWILALAGGWATLTLAGAAASKLASKGKELEPLEKLATVVSTLLLVGVLGTLGRAVLSFAPRGSQTAFATFLDRAFDPAWGVLGGVGERIGVPPDLAGVPTAPLALFTVLFLGRNAISWQMDRLRRGVHSERVSAPSEARTPPKSSPGRQKPK